MDTNVPAIALADGLLGWPGMGPAGPLQWNIVRLYTGDSWYAPRSGWYFFTGCGPGGGGPGGTGTTGKTSSGGAAGGGLINTPIWVPQGVGGPVVIGTPGTGGGSANTNGTAGTDTTFGGDLLILGGGPAGISGSANAAATIGGRLITVNGVVRYQSTGREGIVGVMGSGNGSDGVDGAPGIGRASSYTFNNGIFTSQFSLGGRSPDSAGTGGSGEDFGAGGGGGTSTGAGGPGGIGCLFIAWIGIPSPGTLDW